MPKPRFDLFIQRPAAVRSIDDAALLGLPLLGSIAELDPKRGARLPDASDAARTLQEANRGRFGFVLNRAPVATSTASEPTTSAVEEAAEMPSAAEQRLDVAVDTCWRTSRGRCG
jgi:hypothetical protein